MSMAKSQLSRQDTTILDRFLYKRRYRQDLLLYKSKQDLDNGLQLEPSSWPPLGFCRCVFAGHVSHASFFLDNSMRQRQVRSNSLFLFDMTIPVPFRFAHHCRSSPFFTLYPSNELLHPQPYRLNPLRSGGK